MVRKNSGKHKPSRAESLAKLPTEMQKRLGEFEFGLHGVRDNTKADYLARMMWFGSFLVARGKRSFEKAERKDIDLFLSRYEKPSTKNVFIAVFRHFYKEKPEVVAHLKAYAVELEEITPSDILFSICFNRVSIDQPLSKIIRSRRVIWSSSSLRIRLQSCSWLPAIHHVPMSQ